MPKYDFIFDFGSPNAYLSHSLVKKIEARRGVKFDYQLVLLGGLFKLTSNQPPMMAFGSIPNKMAYIQIEMQRFIKKHALARFNFNSHFPVNTLQLMRCAVAAQLAGGGGLEPFIEMGLRAMWEDGKKMDDEAVLAQEIKNAGLDAEHLIAASKTDEVKQTLMKNTEAAAARGAFGVPTFFIDKEMFFGKETLSEVEALIQK